MTEHDDNAMQSVSDQAAEWFIRLKDRDLSVGRAAQVRALAQAVAESHCRIHAAVPAVRPGQARKAADAAAGRG